MGSRRWLVVIALAVLGAAGLIWKLGPSWSGALDTPAVLARVQRLNQLATVKYTVQQVVGLVEQKEPVGAESILLILQASVVGGVDLAGMGPGDVTVRSNGAVVVRLPPAKILNVTIDEKATKVWDRSKSWWAPWIPYSLGLEQRARIQGVEQAKRAAMEMGILKQAEENAERAVRELLSLGGVEEVTVIPGGAS